jgi:hypothetical protein
MIIMKLKDEKIGTFVDGVPDDVAKKLNIKYMKRMMFLGFAAEKTEDDDAGSSMSKLSNFFSSKDHDKYTELVEKRMTEQMDADKFALMMYKLMQEKKNADEDKDYFKQMELQYRIQKLDNDRSYLWELFLEKEMKKAVSEGNDAKVDDLMDEYTISKGKKIDFEKEFAMRDAYFEMKSAEKNEDYAKAAQLKQKLEFMYDSSQMLDSPLREYFSGS